MPTVARLPGTAPLHADANLPPLDLPTTDLIADRYELRDLLGAGGMGAVYRAYDNELEEFVALKLVREVDPARPTLTALLKQEIRLARKVTHPNVVRTHDLGEHRGIPYISMEYVQGITLKQLLKDRGTLPAAVGLGLMKQVCQGLEAAHRMGVVHRDIKPQNILIVRATGDVKITDFGIAQMSTLDGREGDIIAGTPTYMSPEQAQALATGFASDLYSLGVVLFEVFTGACPFEGPTANELVQQHIESPPPRPRGLNPTLPADLETLILQCLEKEPQRRPASAMAVFLKLEAVSLRYVDESRTASA
jgi:serine/threonine-protein kinase